MKRDLINVALFFIVGTLMGCAWLERQDIDVCVDYKGRHICVGRRHGTWTFSLPLAPDEQADLIARLGQ